MRSASLHNQPLRDGGYQKVDASENGEQHATSKDAGNTQGLEANHSSIARLAAIAYYMASSMLIQLTNKTLFTVFKFNYPFTVAFFQMLITVPICWSVARPAVSWDRAKATLPLAGAHVFNMVFGLIGTGGLNVPMFIAIRRFTLLITIFLERCFLSKRHDFSTLAAVALMVSGALLAAFNDLAFSFWPYAAVLANDVTTASYLIMVKNLPGVKQLTSLGLIFYTSSLSLLPLLLGGLLLQEHTRMQRFDLWDSWSFRITLLISITVGLLVNHSMFLCTRVNDPLTTSVAGNLKNMLMTLLGALLFKDFLYHPLNICGLAVSAAGAVWYAAAAVTRTEKQAGKGGGG